MPVFHKYTQGHVKQSFDETGKCLGQDFVAGDIVEWEDENGARIVVLPPVVLNSYQPFDMLQPGQVETQREQLQEDLSCILDGLDPTMMNNVCQAVVDRFNIILGK
jgi:hypothetical protein